MALKDLAASAAKVNESVIEEIVKDYIRYDVEASAIILTPVANGLTVRQKILTFLTANEGWCYVDEGVATLPIATKDLEQPLGIKGGSLRPAMSRLSKDNLIKKEGKGYHILASNLSKIRKEVLES